MAKKLPKPPVPPDLDLRHLPFPAHELLDKLAPNLSPEKRAEMIRLARSLSPSGIEERH